MIQFELDVPKGEVLEAAADMGDATKAGLTRVADASQQIATRKTNAIRRRRVPTRREVALDRQRERNAKNKREITASNEPAWEPTGQLAKAVQADPIWEGPESVFLTADVPHAERRHGLGVEWIPENPALGVIRRDPFFTETAEIIEPQMGELFAEGFNEEWEKG